MSKAIRNQFVVRFEYVVSKMVDGKAVLLNLNNGAYFSVNPVGAAVWKLCSGKKSAQEIVLAVSRKFSKDKNQVAKDVSKFIEELKRQRLVRITPRSVRVS